MYHAHSCLDTILRLHEQLHSVPALTFLICSFSWGSVQITLFCCTGQAGWHEVEHWLWPAFSPRWASWRQKRLELPATLFSACTGKPQPKSIADNSPEQGTSSVSHHDCSKFVLERLQGRSLSEGPSGSGHADTTQDGISNSDICNSPDALPASIPLLYGLSEQVIQRPGYWPSSVHCCGFWQQKHGHKVSQVVTPGHCLPACSGMQSSCYSNNGH